MKLIFASLIVLSSLTTFAQLLSPYPGNGGGNLSPYPGNGGYPPPPPGGNYPPPPGNGGGYYPPPSNSLCKLEYTGNYYYVSKDGSRFTELTTMQQALSQKQQLENQGMCRPNLQVGSCQLEYTGNYYYVSRNASRFSDLVSGYQSALQTRDQLYNSRNCDENTYRPTASCKIEYTGNYYYVSRNASRFSDLVADLNQVSRTRDDLVRSYVCQPQYQTAPCRLEYTGNYYYISINSARSSDLNANLQAVLNQQVDFANRGLCSQAQSNDRCTIEYTGNYYYVARNSSRISDLVGNMSQASQTLSQLQYSRNCY